MSSTHPLFNPHSLYSRLRAPFRSEGKLAGFWLAIKSRLRSVSERSSRGFGSWAQRSTSHRSVDQQSRPYYVPGNSTQHDDQCHIFAVSVQNVVNLPLASSVTPFANGQGLTVNVVFHDFAADGTLCRLFIFDNVLLQRLILTVSKSQVADPIEARLLNKVFAAETLTRNLETARVLSAVPDVDSSVAEGCAHFDVGLYSPVNELPDDLQFIVVADLNVDDVLDELTHSS